MYTTPNMSLLGITIGVDTGLTIETNSNTNTNTLDSHNHAPGSGVQITPAGLSISSDLPFGSNNATLVRSVRFAVQGSPIAGASDLSCLYASGSAGDLYFNDLSGNQIRMTSGGAVNATSSGIASGTATASFVSSVLVVNAASNTPANIRCASILLGNNISGSNYVTLSPAGSLAASFTMTLPPALPSVNSYIQSDNAGNLSFVSAAAVGTNILTSSLVSLSTGSLTTLATLTLTSNGNPVRIECYGQGSASAGAGGNFSASTSTGTLTVARNGTAISSVQLVVGSTYGPGSMNFTDVSPGTGSVVYTFVANPGASGRVNVQSLFFQVLQ